MGCIIYVHGGNLCTLASTHTHTSAVCVSCKFKIIGKGRKVICISSQDAHLSLSQRCTRVSWSDMQPTKIRMVSWGFRHSPHYIHPTLSQDPLHTRAMCERQFNVANNFSIPRAISSAKRRLLDVYYTLWIWQHSFLCFAETNSIYVAFYTEWKTLLFFFLQILFLGQN